jgi:flagellin-like hook-associated protein FlgL
MLSIGGLAANGSGTSYNLGNIAAQNGTTDGVNSDGFVDDIKNVSVGQFIDIISRIADMRAENGAEQNRVMQRIDLLQSNMTNIEAAHGRIMDADIALESTRFARHNILVQASASMTAQANQLSSVALSLIG